MKIIRSFLTWLKRRQYKQRRKEQYNDFMMSDAWQAIRTKALKRAGWRCQQCGAFDVTLQVHHLTYVRFGGREQDSDLRVLCIPCHKKADKERRKEMRRK